MDGWMDGSMIISGLGGDECRGEDIKMKYINGDAWMYIYTPSF